MWLQARTEVQADIENTYAEYIDATMDHQQQKLSLRICFGGLELGTDDPNLYDYFLPLQDIVDGVIQELTIEFDIPYFNEANYFENFTLIVYPDEDSLLSAFLEEQSWIHISIREWYFVPKK